MIEAWREEYNTQRPHSSLGYLTPAEFAERSRQGEVESGRSVGSGRATPSLRPHSSSEAITLSLVQKTGAGGFPRRAFGRSATTSYFWGSSRCRHIFSGTSGRARLWRGTGIARSTS